MEQPPPATGQVEAVRRSTLAILDRLTTTAEAFELADPPATLGEYQQQLTENSYKVLVVGEAKRGKSTFVNALIGRNILPTDVDISTSRVFHVSDSPVEAYRIRFEDGSERAIAADELPRFGTQAAADLQGEPLLRQIMRWIEVDVPIRFLPKGVSILDTPGLGSLYAAHSQITQRFVPHADAIIYVLDSNQPMGQPDIDFIRTILSVTNNIFFVQTKIDQHRRDDWQEIERRNEAILDEHFKERLADTHVWPVSSTNLIKAAETGDEDYERVSRHRELITALQAFLFQVAGWERCAEAVVVAEYYQLTSRKVLQARLAALEAETVKQSVELQQRVAQQAQQFQSEWGERGTKRRELLEHVQRLVAMHKQNFVEVIQPGGQIEREQREKIDALASLDAINAVGQALAGEVIAKTIDTWRAETQQAHAHCLALLAPFVADVSSFHLPQSSDQPQLVMRAGPTLNLKNDLWSKVKGAPAEFLAAGKAIDDAVGLFGKAIPFLPWVIVAAGLWGIARSWTTSEKAQIKTAQQELQTHLGIVLGDVQQRFLKPDPAHGAMSFLDHTYDALVRTMFEHIHLLATQKANEARGEQARATDAGQLDDPQRAEKASQTRQQIVEWDDLGRELEAVTAELRLLDQALHSPVTTRA